MPDMSSFSFRLRASCHALLVLASTGCTGTVVSTVSDDASVDVVDPSDVIDPSDIAAPTDVTAPRDVTTAKDVVTATDVTDATSPRDVAPDAVTDVASTRDAGFVPVRCDPAPTPSCGAAHELPIPTHFDAATGAYRFLAHDTPPRFVASPLGAGPYRAGSCYPVYAGGFLPDVDRYFADRFSVYGPGDVAARAWADARCAEVGMPVRHVQPPPVDGGGAAPRSGVCELQVIHARVVDGSLATIFLPPGWSASAPPGTYAVVANGFYDANENTFLDGQHGAFMARLVAESATGGRRGAVGVLWNGGGSDASRTLNDGALRQFAAVMRALASDYRADPRWVVMFGGSRGGGTTLAMASNPDRAPYRVVLAAAVAAPTRIGDHAALTSTTYPGLLHAVGWSVGLADAWRTGWTYPSCGLSALAGLTGPRAMLRVLTGTNDTATANDLHSPHSTRYLDGLVAAGTQVHLQVSASDYIIPHALQVRYGRALLARGVAVDARVLVRSGHAGLVEPGHTAPTLDEVVRAAVLRIVAPGFDREGPVPPLVTPGLAYYRVDRASGAMQSFTPTSGRGFPFSLDMPYRAAQGTRVPLVAVGEPGSSWRVTFRLGDTPVLTREATIDADGTRVDWIDLTAAAPAGVYDCAVELRRAASAPWEPIDRANTPTGAPCQVRVEAAEPVVDHAGAAAWASASSTPAFASTAWGVSEY